MIARGAPFSFLSCFSILLCLLEALHFSLLMIQTLSHHPGYVFRKSFDSLAVQ